MRKKLNPKTIFLLFILFISMVLSMGLLGDFNCPASCYKSDSVDDWETISKLIERREKEELRKFEEEWSRTGKYLANLPPMDIDVSLLNYTCAGCACD